MTEESKAPVPAKKTATRRKFTAKQWSEAKALWETGEFTLSQISERVKCSREHLSRKFKKEGIKKGSKSVEAGEAASEAVESEISKAARILPMRINETKEEHYVWGQSLGKLTMQTISRALRDGKPISSQGEELKAIDRAATILNKVMDQRYKALGIDKEDYVDEETLPTLTIDIMTEEQMQQVRSKAREQTLGTEDGLGGVLSDEEDIIEYEDELDDVVIEDEDEDGDS